MGWKDLTPEQQAKVKRMAAIKYEDYPDILRPGVFLLDVDGALEYLKMILGRPIRSGTFLHHIYRTGYLNPIRAGRINLFTVDELDKFAEWRKTRKLGRPPIKKEPEVV